MGEGEKRRGLTIEKLILPHLLNTRLYSPQRTTTNNTKMVLLMLRQLLQLSIHTDTGFQGRFQLRDHFVFFLGDVLFQLVGFHGVHVLGFEGNEHAAEVLADEFFEELGAGVCLSRNC
jgi:hypothetical protein